MSEVIEIRYCPVCDVEVEGDPADFTETSECPECGEWVDFALERRKKKKRKFKRKGSRSGGNSLRGGPVAGTNSASKIETARSEGKPICQLVIGRDQMSAASAVYSEFEKMLKEERLPHVIVVCRNEADADIELHQDDLQIVGSVDDYSLGSQFIRYFLTLLSAVFGYGACKLQISYTIYLPGESRPMIKTFKNKIGIGVMGGSGDALMKLNQKAIAKKLAGLVVNRLTGRRILTSSLRSMAGGSLALGAIGLIFPFIGLVAPCIGIPAFMLMMQRDYKPRRWMAILGSILGLIGGCVWVVFVSMAD